MAKIKIGLDAGHGTPNTGTYSIDSKKDGLYEKDYTLELCKLVGERLEHNGFEAFYTRTGDKTPGDVDVRAKMCVDAGCDYAVSIHFNGFNNESANGCEVFVPYAEKAADIEVGYKKYLTKFFRERKPFARSNNYNNRNETFDKKMNTETKKFGAVSTEKKDYFGFIRNCWRKGVSADLLEICFLTNRKDFDTYTQNKGEVADSIARSIAEAYGKVYKELPGTAAPAGKVYRVRLKNLFTTKQSAEGMVKYLKTRGFYAEVKEE